MIATRCNSIAAGFFAIAGVVLTVQSAAGEPTARIRTETCSF
jgi:hypothetical protein